MINGWLDGVYHRDAHPGRVGGPIAPFAIVVHTTDVPPEAWSAMMARLQNELGAGDGAHFWIGRDAAAGVVQTVPILRNANHAGGPHHGWFVDGDGNRIHPNLCAIGIEIHCAGDVAKFSDGWHSLDGHTPTGAVIPESDVVLDPQRPGRGWHVVTPYQLEQLGMLLDTLETALAPAPAGLHAISPWEAPPAYGVIGGRIVGHVSLDARDRADPWPQAMAWLRERQAKRAAT